MQYMVVGADGKEYGPVDETTLRQWASENRVTPTSQLRDVLSNQTMAASGIAGLFPQMPSAPPTVQNMYTPQAGGTNTPPPPGTAWSQPPSAYPRQGPGYVGKSTDGSGIFWRSIIYSLASVLLFFVIHGLGLIWAGYAVYYAFRSHGMGHSRSIIAIVVSIVALTVVIIGWIIRLNTGAV